MPLYEYRCDACAHEFEDIRSVSEEGPLPCPKCGEPQARRMVSAVHLKGNPSPLKDYGTVKMAPKAGGKPGGCGSGGFS